MRSVLVFCILLSQTAFSQENLEIFNKSIGIEQALAFDAAATSFVQFLALNFPNDSSLAEQNARYLGELKNPNENSKRVWKFPKDMELVKSLWDSGGLRREIWLWPNEKYVPLHYNDSINDIGSLDSIFDEELVPIELRELRNINPEAISDGAMEFNLAGKYIFGLLNIKNSDHFINQYLDVKIDVGDISPSLVANGLFQHKTKFEDAIFIRIMVVEFYAYYLF